MICVILNGGLGNQMFQFAAAKALALKLGTELVLDTSFIDQHSKKSWSRPYELDIFDHSATIRKKGINLNKILIFALPRLRKSNAGRKILSTLNYCIDIECDISQLKDGTTFFGYFTNENFFKEYKNKILSEFTFKYPMDDNCSRISKLIKNCEAVSVHIRRGDYLNDTNSTIFANCSLDWYYNAIQLIKEKVVSPVFFFFSDDMDWVKENFSSHKDSYFVDINKGSSSYNDMRLMSLCKHNIIANSTFSWWGAWLNLHEKKIVIAPKYYYRDQTKQNIMPEDWVLL